MPSIDNSKCVLVTGATSGIGRALALAIAALPSKPVVIAAGRRKERLEELKKAGLETIEVNVDSDNETLKRFADEVVEKYPDLDTVIYGAGVQHELEFHKGINIKNVASEININYTSIVTLVSHFMPHFFRISEQGRPTFIITVTSGLAVTPAPWIFNYCASKAALHSFTISLRIQLQDRNIHVTEIMPPLVESELHDTYGTTERLSKFWMPLDEYTKTTMEGLRRGDKHITCGVVLDTYKRFEEGKDEFAAKALIARSKW